ncbi:lamin tail domain-containing protein [Pedobacter sp. MR22-3]|uniref:lamin tail domain-containing protein n=1 Tax=Pedobacter sp. MR22-3 TaxID=2994552 RepID=UPI002247FCF0|nr:lamin tail domain-containing protein [Pedobacter sp. MR22-3]MCX2583995.1 lamin tail domain-containing protein [Pedobacter sp. MR22-3]
MKRLLLVSFFLVCQFAKAQTPVPMASQPGNTYTENFSSIASWTNGFGSGTVASAFKAVPVNPSGTIPDGVRTTASSATFTTGSSGGVQKGTQNIQLLSTGATDNTSATAIDFLVNFSGVNAGNLSFKWEQVSNSTGNRNGSLRIYTSTDGTNFTELTAAQVLNFTNNVASSGNVNVILPATLNNASSVTFRFYYHNGSGGTTGSRPKISIDDLTVTATTALVPSLSASKSTLDFGTQLINSTPAEQNYSLSSANLNGSNVTLTTAAPYALSKTSGTGFSTSLTYNNNELSAGSNTVYVRFTPVTAGTSAGSITTAGGGVANPPVVSLTGVGQSATLTVDQTALDFGTVTTGTNSTAQTYTLSASGLTDAVNLTSVAPFYISKDNVTYSTSITYTATELASAKTVYACFSPTAATSSTERISIASTGATTQNITVSGIGAAPPVAATHVVISEVYGGGGNSGATYKNDFIELYNPGNAAVDLTGWSVQYGAATGTSWQVTPLTGSIPAKGFFLIQEAAGSGGTQNLPAPDVTGTINMAGTAFKIVLSNSITALSGANPAGAAIVDKVGVGPTANGFEGSGAAAVLTSSTSAERKATASSTVASLSAGGSEEFEGNGYDTNNNNTDFVSNAPNPQNSSIKEPTGASHVVISEIYGGGGNSGSTYKNDFIELYNPTSSAVSLNGWSVQYASATGTSWQVTTLSGSIAPKGFYLIQQAAGTGGTTNLPTPDRIGTINMAGAAGKVLLSNAATAQTGATPTGASIIDFVGFGTANGFEGTGPAAAPSSTFSIERKASATSDVTTLGTGGTEEFSGNGFDSDDNAFDFLAKAVNPQNTTVSEPVSTTGPYLSVSPKGLTFTNQAINTTSAAQRYVLSAGNLTGATTLTTTAPYSLSKDNINFSATISYSATDLTGNQTVYVRFSPTTVGNATGAVLHASAGAPSISLSLSGAAIDPNQTVFNFENCTTAGSPALADGFYQYSVAGPQTWGCTTSFGHDANDAAGTASAGNALQINGYSGGNILNEDWLISPALNLSSMNYAVLSFWTRSAFAGDKLQLKVSTDYTGSGNPALATWVNLDGKFPESGSDVWTKSGNIDLTAYKATPVYVAIVYNSSTTAASRWTVDDFAVLNSATLPPVDISTSTTGVNFGYQANGTTSAEKSFSFSAGNLTGDVTVTAPANFTISSTSGGTFGTSLNYTRAAINNTSPTIYAKFSPTAVNTTYAADVSIATAGSANKKVNLSGNTFDAANTLEVVNWNIEWFGSPAQDPSNDVQQAANVKTIVNNINADVYGFAEVVDTTLFRNTVLPAGYNVIFSSFGSYADNKADANYPLAQKLAFMYRTDLLKPIRTFGILEDTYNPAVAATSADGTPYKNWSSGRFPFAMEAEVSINGKKESLYFIEIHAKANTGTTADQIDAYNRRKGGNKQLKDWIDANLAGKKVIILGDFNDVLNPDKTIAPMPAGTGTSYVDFTQDAANYFPITLPLSLAGKQSTAGFNTVIDNVILTKSLNLNYIQGTAEVLDAVKTLVTNYSSTTTDHYPIKSRYLFGNGAPTVDAVANQAVCYAPANQTIAVTGISAGPEAAQTTTLSVTSDQANVFEVLSIAANGADQGTITYRLKNNTAAEANITVTVTDNGGTDFGGVNQISKTFKLTATPAATGTITGTTAVCLNGDAPAITFTGANGTAPYTFTYNINGGTSQMVTTAGTSNSVTVNAPANLAGTFTYNLLNVKDANCGQAQTGTATVTVRTLATAGISGSTAIPQNSTAPVITFTGANGTAPYTFTYTINGGTNRTVTSTGNTATIAVPTAAAGTFVYNLVSVADVNCGQPQSGTATVLVRPLPVANLSGTTAVCHFSTSPVVTFTGSGGTAPYTFTYTVNGGSNRTVTANEATATVNVPTSSTGTFIYALVSVADAYATQLQTGNVSVVVNPLPVITISSNKGFSISKGDDIILTASGGSQYSWTGAEISSGRNAASVTIRPKQSGTYQVTVTNANGCTAEQSISITVIDDYKLEASTVVTPNGDGYNDRFIVKNIDYYPKNTLKIFDKAGRVLYTRQAYANDWDGTVNGSPLAEGTYYYIIDLGTGIRTFKGYINIIRD